MNAPSETFRLNVEAPTADARTLSWNDPDGVAHRVTVNTSAIHGDLPSVLRHLLRGGWQEMDCSKAGRERLRAYLLDGPDRLGELRARATLAGWTITQTADGYLVSRWGMSKSLPDLPAVEAFISRATGVKP